MNISSSDGAVVKREEETKHPELVDRIRRLA